MERKLLSTILVAAILASLLTCSYADSNEVDFTAPEASPPTPGQVGASSPYKHLGASTTYGENGIEVSIDVMDPLLPHDGSYNQFFYAWAMVHSDTWVQWIQVGWSEVSWKDNTQYVTEYDTEDNQWYFYPEYSLTLGNTYSFRITYQGNGRWATWIFWDNAWQLLREAFIGISSAEHTGQFCEVYSATYDWFHVWGVRFHDTRLLIDGAWSLWTTAYPAYKYNWNLPYYVRWFNKYYFWEFTDIKVGPQI